MIDPWLDAAKIEVFGKALKRETVPERGSIWKKAVKFYLPLEQKGIFLIISPQEWK